MTQPLIYDITENKRWTGERIETFDFKEGRSYVCITPPARLEIPLGARVLLMPVSDEQWSGDISSEQRAILREFMEAPRLV